ncbi:hypothetical protein KM043_008712 [Ampulex compressa]|nr:hypothetical protein KM043_008712 [Ampulex compressa]
MASQSAVAKRGKTLGSAHEEGGDEERRRGSEQARAGGEVAGLEDVGDTCVATLTSSVPGTAGVRPNRRTRPLSLAVQPLNYQRLDPEPKPATGIVLPSQHPNMTSQESIGSCSLDVDRSASDRSENTVDSVSEKTLHSLNLSCNGEPQASSPENLANGSSETLQKSHLTPDERPNVSNGHRASPETEQLTVKKPSYLGLACSISGYSGLTRYDSKLREGFRSRDSSPGTRLITRDTSPAGFRSNENLSVPTHHYPPKSQSISPLAMDRQNGFANGLKEECKIETYRESRSSMSICQGYSEVDKGVSLHATFPDISPIRPKTPAKRSPGISQAMSCGQQNKTLAPQFAVSSPKQAPPNLSSASFSETTMLNGSSVETETQVSTTSSSSEKSFIQQRVERLYGPGALAQGFFFKRSTTKLNVSESGVNKSGNNDASTDNANAEESLKNLPVLRHLRPEFRAQLPVVSPRKPTDGTEQIIKPLQRVTPVSRKGEQKPKISVTSNLSCSGTESGTSKLNASVTSITDQQPAAPKVVLPVLEPSASSASIAKQAAEAEAAPKEKDGHYFLKLLQQETDRLLSLASMAEAELASADAVALPEEAAGKLRSAAGKARLLASQKMQQFEGLCQKNIIQVPGEEFPTTNEDLAGFWDMVMLQVVQVNELFEQIEKLKKSQWQEVREVILTPRRSAIESPKRSSKTIRERKTERCTLDSLAPTSVNNSSNTFLSSAKDSVSGKDPLKGRENQHNDIVFGTYRQEELWKNPCPVPQHSPFIVNYVNLFNPDDNPLYVEKDLLDVVRPRENNFEGRRFHRTLRNVSSEIELNLPQKYPYDGSEKLSNNFHVNEKAKNASENSKMKYDRSDANELKSKASKLVHGRSTSHAQNSTAQPRARSESPKIGYRAKEKTRLRNELTTGKIKKSWNDHKTKYGERVISRPPEVSSGTKKRNKKSKYNVRFSDDVEDNIDGAVNSTGNAILANPTTLVKVPKYRANTTNVSSLSLSKTRSKSRLYGVHHPPKKISSSKGNRELSVLRKSKPLRNFSLNATPSKNKLSREISNANNESLERKIPQVHFSHQYNFIDPTVDRIDRDSNLKKSTSDKASITDDLEDKKLVDVPQKRAKNKKLRNEIKLKGNEISAVQAKIAKNLSRLSSRDVEPKRDKPGKFSIFTEIWSSLDRVRNKVGSAKRSFGGIWLSKNDDEKRNTETPEIEYQGKTSSKFSESLDGIIWSQSDSKPFVPLAQETLKQLRGIYRTEKQLKLAVVSNGPNKLERMRVYDKRRKLGLKGNEDRCSKEFSSEHGSVPNSSSSSTSSAKDSEFGDFPKILRACDNDDARKESAIYPPAISNYANTYVMNVEADTTCVLNAIRNLSRDKLHRFVSTILNSLDSAILSGISNSTANGTLEESQSRVCAPEISPKSNSDIFLPTDWQQLDTNAISTSPTAVSFYATSDAFTKTIDTEPNEERLSLELPDVTYSNIRLYDKPRNGRRWCNALEWGNRSAKSILEFDRYLPLKREKSARHRIGKVECLRAFPEKTRLDRRYLEKTSAIPAKIKRACAFVRANRTLCRLSLYLYIYGMLSLVLILFRVIPYKHCSLDAKIVPEKKEMGAAPQNGGTTKRRVVAVHKGKSSVSSEASKKAKEAREAREVARRQLIEERRRAMRAGAQKAEDTVKIFAPET